MSTNSKEQTNNSDYIDWIEKAIEDNYITYFDYDEFTNKQEFENSDTSSVGKIFKANYKNNDTPLIVKTPGLDIKKFINELKIRKEVDFHTNILQIHGISKFDNQYSLVLEYADGGTLYSYLKENFIKLEWNDKYRLALQLASAIECIHNKGIIHCDLHAHNVLIHKNDIKVANFGLAKKASEASNYSIEVYDLLPYIDPRNLSNIKHRDQPCIMDFKSDIYSIGVLLWLLSSGRKPFCDEGIQYDARLAMDIIGGKREEIIKGTPIKYSNIYKACWENDPDERPSIQKVVSYLTSYQDINEETNSIKFEKKNEIKKGASNKDFDYIIIDDDLIIDEDILNSIIQNDLQNDLLINITDSDDIEKIINKLIDHLIKMHDEFGYGFAEVKQIIEQNIKNINQTLLNNIPNWLKNQTSSPKYNFFHGFLYFNGIIVKNNGDRAFGLFSKSSKENYPMAQVYLGKLCTVPKIQIDWYQKSAKNGNKLAEFYLGNWYENVKKDDFKAFECYEKAANVGNKIAQLNLGYFYDNGIGTEKNKEKAIEWYEKSANQKCSNAQLFLGILYKGTKKDSKNSFELVEKTAKSGNKISQFYLGKYYYHGTGVKKDYGKSFEWYEKSAKQGYNDALCALGYLYLKGKGTEKNLGKAFNLIEEAAEKGSKYAQHYLGTIYRHDKGDIVKAIEWYKKSAEQEYNEAQNSLGCLYEEIYQDLDESLYWYEKAAKNGNKFAQYKLGCFYENGKGKQKDVKKAIEWYEKSAKQGCSFAQYCLGYSFENGEGIDQDLGKAIYWYKKAAEDGNKTAQYRIGYLYENGRGMRKDIKKAIEWYEKSAIQEYNNAQCSLGYLYEKGKGIDQDLSKAVYWYKKAADNGYEAAYYCLGKCHQDGIGIEKDEVKAFEYYKKSAEKGYLNGIYILGYCYENGIGTEIDKEKAIELYKDAANRGNKDAPKRLEMMSS
ncbi:HCP-like protein [Rhizophagus irregularis]|uniref:HCP-like protein n=1 Tax=Rhizophagus irregularis TaxID=588596 RepID=A0A2N0RWZ8_9GLOM|nr:HCP-like protein [Rhizophagus irregularis]